MLLCFQLNDNAYISEDYDRIQIYNLHINIYIFCIYLYYSNTRILHVIFTSAGSKQQFPAPHSQMYSGRLKDYLSVTSQFYILWWAAHGAPYWLLWGQPLKWPLMFSFFRMAQVDFIKSTVQWEIWNALTRNSGKG